MKRTIATVMSMLVIAQAAQAIEKVEAKGTIKAVTLFRGQALVTRVVPVEGGSGSIQLTISDLPPSVLGHSLFVTADDDLKVRAVRYHTSATGKAPKEEVQKIDDQIEDIEKKLRAISHEKNLVNSKTDHINRMDIFVAPTAKTELTKGVLNTETLSEVTKMIFENRDVLGAEGLELDEEARSLNKELSLLRRKRSELSQSHTKTLREAIVFIDKTGDRKSKLKLSYLVSNAYWSPTYNIRSASGSKLANVEIGALANQSSGESWDSVDLTLSTAGAQLVADGPTLAPLDLNLTTSYKEKGWKSLSRGSFGKRYQTVADNLKMEQARQQSSVDFLSNASAQWNMNTWGQEVQQLELVADPDDFRAASLKFGSKGSGLAVTYKIEGKVNIASQRDNQMVQIDQLTLPTTFFYEAAPLLTEQVYRYAEMQNNSSISLLEGNASIYLDDEYMGTATLPMVAQGQKVTVGFGTNPQLRAWREFVSKDKKEHIIGSKKDVSYTYRIVLDNYSDKDVEVRVFDRIPKQTELVTVMLDPLIEDLSRDVQYKRIYRPQGILRWDTTVPKKATRETAKIINYGFKLKLDTKYTIATTPPAKPNATQKAEFNDMLEMRMYSH